jgi:hypothetical protein
MSGKSLGTGSFSETCGVFWVQALDMGDVLHDR